MSNNIWCCVNDSAGYYPVYGVQSILLHQNPPISRYTTDPKLHRFDKISSVFLILHKVRFGNINALTGRGHVDCTPHLNSRRKRGCARNERYVKWRPITAGTFKPQRKSSEHNPPLQQVSIPFSKPLNHNDKYMHHLTTLEFLRFGPRIYLWASYDSRRRWAIILHTAVISICDGEFVSFFFCGRYHPFLFYKNELHASNVEL